MISEKSNHRSGESFEILNIIDLKINNGEIVKAADAPGKLASANTKNFILYFFALRKEFNHIFVFVKRHIAESGDCILVMANGRKVLKTK